MDPEQLAHEMTLDKFYRLPAERQSDAAETQSALSPAAGPITKNTPTAVVAAKLRAQLLASMADKMVNSLRTSAVRSVNEVCVVISLALICLACFQLK